MTPFERAHEEFYEAATPEALREPGGRERMEKALEHYKHAVQQLQTTREERNDILREASIRATKAAIRANAPPTA